MKDLGRYQVTGRFKYRGHEIGSVFEAYLPPGAEYRATQRGSITLLERIPADLIPGSYRLPFGWPNTQGKEGLANG